MQCTFFVLCNQTTTHWEFKKAERVYHPTTATNNQDPGCRVCSTTAAEQKWTPREMHVSCSYFSGHPPRTLNIRTKMQTNKKNPNPHYENSTYRTILFLGRWCTETAIVWASKIWLDAYWVPCNRTIIFYVLFHSPLFPFSVKTLCTNSTLLSMNKEEKPCQWAKFWWWSAWRCNVQQWFGGWPEPGD